MQGQKPIKVLKQDDLVQDFDVHIKIENCRFLASYNWTKDKEPTILVPGAPAIWKPPNLPATIRKDDGEANINENSDRILAPSFAPFFATLLIMQPSYSFLNTSLVTDRNSLRKLLDWVCGRSHSNWQIEVELVRDTLFFTRWEKNKVQIITGSFNSGYGHEFEKAFLKFGEGFEESSTHHRIIQYNIGGMEWVVRYEADGYVEQDTGKEIAAASKGYLSESELSTRMVELSVKNDSTSMNSCGVTVVRKGHLVPETSIIEVKCESTRRHGNQLAKHTPQCWLSQTGIMFCGHHSRGLVDSVNSVEIARNFEDWEESHQHTLGLLVNLIQKIKEIAGQSSAGKCSLVCNHREKPAVLRIFESNDDRLQLSAEVKERYWRV